MPVCMARQPIFNRDQKVVAYGLLHRTREVNFYHKNAGDRAASELL